MQNVHALLLLTLSYLFGFYCLSYNCGILLLMLMLLLAHKHTDTVQACVSIDDETT